jgi:ribosomal protein L29
MIPQKDQHVKCFLRTGMVLEGTVEEWTDAQVVLCSMEGQNLMILHSPTQDILLTKIILAPEAVAAPDPVKPEDIKQKLEEVQKIEDPELRSKSVEELRQLVVQQEKEIVANKTKEHFGSTSAPKMTRYSSPYTPGKIPSWVYGRPPAKGK